MITLNRKPTADELQHAIRCDTNGDTLTLYYAGDDVPLMVSEPDPTPDVPMLAFRKGLTEAGLREAVEDYVRAASLEVQDEWAQRQTVHFDNPLIRAAAVALGVTDEQFAALWARCVQIAETL